MTINKLIKRILFGRETDEFVKIYYKYDKTKNKIKKLYYFYVLKKIERKFNCSIPVKTKIGENITFPHGLNGIFISQGATIGKQCVIFQQVTIGSNTLKDSKSAGVPSIGDNVYIGAGAKIIGNVKIGNNVRIGANCIVIEDVPDDTTCVMSKPRMIKSNSKRDNSFKGLEIERNEVKK